MLENALLSNKKRSQVVLSQQLNTGRNHRLTQLKTIKIIKLNASNSVKNIAYN